MTKQRKQRKPRIVSGILGLIATAVVMVLLANGCGDDGSDTSARAEMDEPYDVAGDDAAADTDEAMGVVAEDTSGAMSGSAMSDFAEAAADEQDFLPPPTTTILPASNSAPTAPGLAVASGVSPVDLGRDIIFRAAITVEVEDVSAASRQATDIVAGLGGFVFGQETTAAPRPRTILTFKVRPDDFNVALERLAGVGELVEQRVSTDDVTDRIVDLQSQMITNENSVRRLRSFLESAPDVDQVARIERELLERETQLELLRGRLRTLRDQVDLATITLTIEQSPEILPESGIEVHLWVASGSEDPCLGGQSLYVVHELSQPDPAAEPGPEVSYCLEVDNRGETALTSLEVSSEPLRLDEGAFTVTQNSFNRLESGERLVAKLTQQVVNGRLGSWAITRGPLELRLWVTATPVDSAGEELREVTGVADAYIHIDFRQPPTGDSLPGFGDSFGRGVSFVQTLIGVVVVVAGVALPLLPVVAAVVAGLWLRRHHLRDRSPADGTVDPGGDRAGASSRLRRRTSARPGHADPAGNQVGTAAPAGSGDADAADDGGSPDDTGRAS